VATQIYGGTGFPVMTPSARWRQWLVATIASACGTAAVAETKTIVIGGSSTVFPISQAAIQRFKPAANAKGLRFEARSVGTSAGFREFCSGKLAIAAASRPINAKELKTCADAGVRFLELPIAFDAITIVVNPRNSWAKQISTQELSNLWQKAAQQRVTTWKQVNSQWPEQPIKLCGPGRDSGTYDYFNKAINGSEDNSRRDYTASEDDAVIVNCVAKSQNALGYFGYDYYSSNRNKLRALAVHGSKGSVLPSVETVQNSRYLPLSRPLFFYVNEKVMKAEPLVHKFVATTIEAGQRIAKEAGAIPLPDSTYRLVTTKLYRNVLGSAYAGNLPVGLTVGQTLDRSFDNIKKPQFR
jgi:phosphate transport system substrate-binding protein